MGVGDEGVKEDLVESSTILLVENEHAHHEVAEFERVPAADGGEESVHVALVEPDVGLFVAQFGRFARH